MALYYDSRLGRYMETLVGAESSDDLRAKATACKR